MKKEQNSVDYCADNILSVLFSAIFTITGLYIAGSNLL